jgi:hypothetical protein
MGNCKDCRSWDKDSFLCGAVVIDMVDENPYGALSPGEMDFIIAVMVDDDQGLDAGLKTGPLFGCVQFQRK